MTTSPLHLELTRVLDGLLLLERRLINLKARLHRAMLRWPPDDPRVRRLLGRLGDY